MHGYALPCADNQIHQQQYPGPQHPHPQHPHPQNPPPQVKRKEMYEAQLAQIERDIEKLSKAVVYVELNS